MVAAPKAITGVPPLTLVPGATVRVVLAVPKVSAPRVCVIPDEAALSLSVRRMELAVSEVL